MAKFFTNPKVIAGLVAGGILYGTKPTEQSFTPFYRNFVGDMFKKELEKQQIPADPIKLTFLTESFLFVSNKQVNDYILFRTTNVAIVQPPIKMNFVGIVNTWVQVGSSSIDKSDE